MLSAQGAISPDNVQVGRLQHIVQAVPYCFSLSGAPACAKVPMYSSAPKSAVSSHPPRLLTVVMQRFR